MKQHFIKYLTAKKERIIVLYPPQRASMQEDHWVLRMHAIRI